MKEPNPFPSTAIEHPAPVAWLQWKGTDACMDIWCKCGAQHHFDGRYCYHIKCPACGQVYECDGHITLRPLDFEPEHTILLVDEEAELEAIIDGWFVQDAEK